MASSAATAAAFVANQGGNDVGGGTAAAPAVVADREVDQAEDVRTILKRKEEEVKEMLAPEKDMHGESWIAGQLCCVVTQMEYLYRSPNIIRCCSACCCTIPI